MFGGHEVHATVLEDRGPVGAKGRRMLRIRLDVGVTSEPIEFEIPADDVKVAA
jgi:hypothetical protein